MDSSRHRPELNSRALRTVKLMTQKYFFHNFTSYPFTGYWNGKAYVFKPGIKKEYAKGIAEHFAKHLTNDVLNKKGLEAYTSPKKPQDVPEFMEVFKKAFLIEEIPDEDNLDIGGPEMVDGPSMNIKVSAPQPIDPYDAHANPVTGPGSAPQIIGGDEEKETDDESTFEGNLE